ncbi:MAG: hypothetical protein R3F21_02600 [Myxococcota bacterium]
MSEADLAESFWNAQEMGVNALMLYLTVISGYLVVAYLVGRDLTASQSRFISSIFVVFSGYALWGVVQYWWTGDQLRVFLESHEFGRVATLNALNLNPALIAGPMGLAGILGALRFMFDTRRIESEPPEDSRP